MRRLISIATVSVALAGISVAAFGWPGAVLLLALAPGMILGSVIAHLSDAWIGRVELRVGFSIVGIVLGIFSAMIAVLFIGAATVDADVRIERTLWMPQPAEFIWESVEEPIAWGRWDAWLGRIEPGAEPGSDQPRYKTTLIMGSTEIPTTHWPDKIVAPSLFSWRIALEPGSALVNVSQSLSLAPERDGTRVTYAIAYELPNVMSRALHALLFSRGLEITAETSLEALRVLIEGRELE